MVQLFSIEEICRVTGGEARHVSAAGISSISIDSRALAPDALFVAIKGDRFDGHDFVAQAMANGAAAALVSADKAEQLGDAPLIVVPDALEGLRHLAEAARARSAARIVAVTGSVGKTTTKEALRTVLSAFGDTHASIKSYNNHWGVPLMLAGLPTNADFGVFEMGMNHAGEIAPLSRLVRPEIAVITSIAPAHIGYLGSLEAIAQAKAEIFEGVRSGGLAIINADHECLPQLRDAAAAHGVRTLTYGYADGADVVIGDFAATEGGCSAIIGPDTPVALTLNVPGRHMMSNATAALLVTRELGLDQVKAAQALAGFAAAEGRGQAALIGKPAKPLLLVDESYNANPASMKAALDVFSARKAPGGRKVLVLGDMFELGDHSAELHHSLKQEVLASGADLVFLVGKDIQRLAPEISGQIEIGGQAETTPDIEQAVLHSLAAGDAVMLKASLGIGLGALVTAIRNKFIKDA